MADRSDLMEVSRKRSIAESHDELQRELQVRKRCFKRWIAEGRMSATDAQDRYDRLASAIEALTDRMTLEAVAAQSTVTSSGDMTAK